MRGRPPPSEQLGVGVDSYEFRHKRLSTVDEDELELEDKELDAELLLEAEAGDLGGVARI